MGNRFSFTPIKCSYGPLHITSRGDHLVGKFFNLEKKKSSFVGPKPKQKVPGKHRKVPCFFGSWTAVLGVKLMGIYSNLLFRFYYRMMTEPQKWSWCFFWTQPKKNARNIFTKKKPSSFHTFLWAFSRISESGNVESFLFKKIAVRRRFQLS